jgi:hypothetical protein
VSYIQYDPEEYLSGMPECPKNMKSVQLMYKASMLLQDWLKDPSYHVDHALVM